MKKLLLALLLSLSAGRASAVVATLQPSDCRFYSSLTAGSDRTSVARDLLVYHFASFHVVWASLTGTVNATVKLQVSDDNANWVDKSGAAFNLAGASGSDMISLTTITEKYYRVVYLHVGVSGGTLNGFCTAKE